MATIPSPRWGAAMAELPTSNEVVLYGGKSTSGTTNGLLNDCYTFNGVSWNLVGNNLPPGPRFNAGMAYDGTKITMIGGSDGQSILTDSWSFDNVSWRQNNLGSNLFALMSHGMAYMSGSSKAILFGGRSFIKTFITDTFTWQSPNTLSKLSNTVFPPGRANACFASNSTTAILFGGKNFDILSDTWKFTSSNWSQITGFVAGTNCPSARFGGMMAYHAAMGKFIVFGGQTYDGSFNNELWSFDGVSTWQNITPATSPSARSFGAMAYNSATNSIILFGGLNYSNALNDFWSLNSSGVWTQLG